MAGVYLHIPFCKQACHYCDFHFSTNQDIKSDLIDAMCRELATRKEYLGDEAVETIYFGGGTPSLLAAAEIRKLLDEVSNIFTLGADPEITLEANPDDLSRAKLGDLYQSGINRLSIGIQTFSNDLLTFLHRVHDEKMAIQCVHDARHVGFENINLDLIYAIPGQSVETLKSDLDKLIQLEPEHVSCYGLTIEEKTVFGKWAKKGKFNEVPEETNAEHFELVMSTLTNSGYDHYEISNFSKPGYPSKHNSAYWRGRRYIGIGPSAHSYDGLSRQFNVSNNYRYVKALQQSDPYFEGEILTETDKINEYLLTSLRTSWGCDLAYLKNELNYDIVSEQSNYLKQLLESGLITLEDGVIRLTQKGKFVADGILADIVLVNSGKHEN